MYMWRNILYLEKVCYKNGCILSKNWKFLSVAPIATFQIFNGALFVKVSGYRSVRRADEFF